PDGRVLRDRPHADRDAGAQGPGRRRERFRVRLPRLRDGAERALLRDRHGAGPRAPRGRAPARPPRAGAARRRPGGRTRAPRRRRARGARRVDGRTQVYGEETLRAYRAMVFLEPGWRAFLDRTRPDVVLWPKRTAFAHVVELLPE